MSTQARERRGYARISNDPRDQRTGVARQKREGNERAESMGLPVDYWHVDNDKSAYDDQVWREEFEKLVADILARQVEVVFAWDQDRIARDVSVWERFLKACQRTGTRIVFVTAGEQFIDTVSGRTTTRFNAVIAVQESEHKAERIISVTKERATNGKAHGQVLYGWRRVYQMDAAGLPIRGAWHDEVHEEHAAVIREGARRVLGGETIVGIIRSLDERGIMSPRGKSWSHAAFRTLLLRPANAGLRIYKGAPRFEAEAPALLDRGDWERLVALMKDPARRPITDNRVRYLLSGIARCGKCDRPMRHKILRPNGTSRYACPRGCVGRVREPVDQIVTDFVTARLSQPDAIELLARDDAAAKDAANQAAELRARLATMGDDYADGAMTRDEWKRMTARIRPKLEAAEAAARVTSSRSGDVLAGVIGTDAAERFDALPITAKRSVIEMMVRVRILAVGQKGGGNTGFNPDSVEVMFRELAAEA
jgi:site-specific DNA recombinase